MKFRKGGKELSIKITITFPLICRHNSAQFTYKKAPIKSDSRPMVMWIRDPISKFHTKTVQKLLELIALDHCI